MRKTALFAAVLALATACEFENPIDWDSLVFAAPDSEDGVEDLDVFEDQADQQDNVEPADVADIHDDLDAVDVLDVKDGKDAEAVNPCPEGEYPDPQLMKCLKYPCCGIGGAWMLQMGDSTGGPANNYAIMITQAKAYIVMDVLSAAQGSVALPDSVQGTLVDDVLHLDGGDPGVTGFLMMDAKKVEKQLFEAGTIFGAYKLVINGEPTHSGSWTLTPN